MRVFKYGLNRLASLFQSDLAKIKTFSRFPIKAVLQVLLTTLVLVAMASVSRADDVTLAWDANTDPGVMGYKLYYGTASGVYPTLYRCR